MSLKDVQETVEARDRDRDRDRLGREAVVRTRHGSHIATKEKQDVCVSLFLFDDVVCYMECCI